MLRSLKTGKLQDLAKEQIKAFILDSGLKSGDQLPTETSMAEKLGVSKTTVREALKALANVGILESRHGVGTFIKKFSYEAILENLPYSLEADVHSLQEVIEIRACLERHFIAQDMERFNDQDIEDLWSIYRELEKATSQKLLKDEIEIHAAFHCALYRHCGNRLLIKLIRIFATLQRNLALVNQYRGTDPDRFLLQHRDIIEAIQKKDAEMALRVMEGHFTDLLDSLSQEKAQTQGGEGGIPGGQPRTAHD
ncbi:MAG: FCD domain-containing protein [Spirochaetia bacterium]|jgi:DNA-binding FadR family transcriptional regulator